VTNDTLQALREVLAFPGADGETPARKPLSSLEAELAAWRQAHKPTPPLSSPYGNSQRRSRYLTARRAAGRQVERAMVQADRRYQPWPGRWSLVHRIGVWGKELPFAEQVERQARQLLQCYGIVTQQSLEIWELGSAESALDWATLYRQFQMMEMRGEVRRGYFVQGLPGVQFALPEAVERLREWTRTPAQQGDGPAPDHVPGEAADLVLMNASDPANLFGPALAGDQEQAHDPARFVRIPSNHVVLLRGRPVLLLEAGGERLTTLPDLPAGTLRQALTLAVRHIGHAQRRLALSEWNGEPIIDSSLAPILEQAGFRREALTYIWQP
jgi:ATP-dependent Lhr-like helicase